MSSTFMKSWGLAVLLCAGGLFAQQPLIKSFNLSGELEWTNPVPGNLSVIERSTNLFAGPWIPYFYDWGTNGTRTSRIPGPASDQTYFRIGVQTNIPDPSLVMHLSFDNYLPDGAVLDISGHGNHGLRYGRPLYPTNWPSAITGPDGSRAAEFHYYFDGYGLYGKSGDYVGIKASSDFLNMTQATITIWAHYYTSINGDINNDHNSTLLFSGQDYAGAWSLGRIYSSHTMFSIFTGPGSAVEALSFPDTSPNGNSGGWHYYTVTFSNGVVRGYFDGNLFKTTTTPVAALNMAGYYIGMAVWTFNVTPELDMSVDGHPNNAWLNGKTDDVRIYNRALSSAEILQLYRSFDKLPPTVPANLAAETNASSLVTLRWGPSTDLFGINAYVLLRDGVVVNETTNTFFFDSGLTANTTYSYAVRARDSLGHLSAPTPPVVVTTRPLEGGVDLILDDADGAPWIVPTGAWPTAYLSNTVLTGLFRTSFVSDDRANKGKTFTFAPPLPESGAYNVYIWYPGRSDIAYLFSPAVPVDIVSAGVTNTVSVNQQVGIGQWRLLGQFPLAPGAYVRIRTDGTSTSHYVVGDAVRFVK